MILQLFFVTLCLFSYHKSYYISFLKLNPDELGKF